MNEIGYWLFRGCKNLKSVDIPNSIITIGGLAFMNCQSLEKIYFPDSVNYIGYGVFTGCIELKSILFPVADTQFFQTKEFICRKIFKENICIDSFLGNNTDVFIPAEIEGRTVTTIGNSAFCDCETLESVTMPNSVVKIEDMAFRCCRNLKSVKISTRLEYIGDFTFDYCTYLDTIDLPNSVSQIGRYAFDSCLNLEKFIIPPNLKTLGDYVFNGCTNLKNIYCPKSLKHIKSIALNIYRLSDESKCKVHYYKISKQVSDRIDKIINFPNISKKIYNWLQDIKFFLVSHKSDISIDDYVNTILNNIERLHSLQQNLGKNFAFNLIMLINLVSDKKITSPEIIKMEVQIQKQIDDLENYSDISLSLFEDVNLKLF